MRAKVNGDTVEILRSTYLNNDTLAIMLDDAEDGEPYADLTVNLPDSSFLCSRDTAFVDTSNCPWAEDFIKKNKLGVPTGRSSGKYPHYRFDISKIPEI